jgi:ABC-2 type transport system permease protein
MRIYLELVRTSFQQQFAYRAATIAGLFTNGVFGVMIASIFIAFYRSREGDATVATWSVEETVTLIWINQSLLMTVFIWGWWEVTRSIQTGAIITELLKPFDYFGYWLSRDLGRALAHFLLRAIPTFTIGALLFDLLPPAGFAAAIGFLASIALAVTISFCLRFLANLAGFWVFDHRGVAMMYVAIINFFSGLLAPLDFLPGPVHTLANLLPYRAVLMVPNEVYLGRTPVWEGLGLQLFWILVLAVAGRWIVRAGEQKLVVQGG